MSTISPSYPATLSGKPCALVIVRDNGCCWCELVRPGRRFNLVCTFPDAYGDPYSLPDAKLAADMRVLLTSEAVAPYLKPEGWPC